MKLFWAGHEPAALRDRGRGARAGRAAHARATTAPSTAAGGRSGCSRRAPTRSWAARARSSATSSASACSGCPREPKRAMTTRRRRRRSTSSIPQRYARDGYPHDALDAAAGRGTRSRASSRPGYEPFWAITKHADILRDLEATAAVLERAGHHAAPRRAPVLPPSEMVVHARPAQARPGAPGRERRASRPRRCGRDATTSSASRSRSSTRPRRPARAGELDFVERIAAPFPLAVIAWILGVPSDDWATAVPLDQRGDRQGRPGVPAAGRDRRARRSSAPAARCTCTSSALIDRAPARPAGRPGERADRRRDRRRAAHATSSSSRTASCSSKPGNETTRNAISGGLLALLRAPRASGRSCAADPELLPDAVEEILRWVEPDQPLHPRRHRGLRGARRRRSAAGEQLALYFASANRDEEVFDDPFAFRIDRRPNPHLAFGFGEHFCMGAHVARVELETIFRHLLRAARVVRGRRGRSSA